MVDQLSTIIPTLILMVLLFSQTQFHVASEDFSAQVDFCRCLSSCHGSIPSFAHPSAFVSSACYLACPTHLHI